MTASIFFSCRCLFLFLFSFLQNFVDRFNFRTVARELIPGDEPLPPSTQKDAPSCARNYRRSSRLRHWLRLLLQKQSCLTSQIMEIGDQAFRLKQLISTLETICNRHNLSMPTNEGLFPLRGLGTVSLTTVSIIFSCSFCCCLLLLLFRSSLVVGHQEEANQYLTQGKKL